MAKSQKQSPLTQVSSAEGHTVIEVEFENAVYDGIFSIITLGGSGKYRGQVQYRDHMPVVFGTYSESDMPQIEKAARKELLDLISGLPRAERIPKRKA